jgi:hypothetical protein
MEKKLILVLIVWGGSRYRTGVFSTEKKAKLFLLSELKDAMVWVSAIDDGLDQHYIKEPIISHVDFSDALKHVSDRIDKLLQSNIVHDYEVMIADITPNEPIQIK